MSGIRKATARDVKLTSHYSTSDSALDLSHICSRYSTTFDGVDEYVDKTDNATLDVTNNLTVAFWIKYSGTNGTEINSGKFDASWNERVWACENEDALMNVYLSDDGANLRKGYQTSVTVGDGTWHHFAFTFVSDTLKLYVDGSEDTSVTKAIDATCNTLHSDAAPFTIGNVFNAGSPWSGRFFTGSVDEFVMFDTAVLSGAEIAELYNLGKPADISKHSQYANVVSWWKMGELDSAQITDQVGTNHLSFNNMTAAANFAEDAP